MIMFLPVTLSTYAQNDHQSVTQQPHHLLKFLNDCQLRLSDQTGVRSKETNLFSDFPILIPFNCAIVLTQIILEIIIKIIIIL